jgi:hypothetical protein
MDGSSLTKSGHSGSSRVWRRPPGQAQSLAPPTDTVSHTPHPRMQMCAIESKDGARHASPCSDDRFLGHQAASETLPLTSKAGHHLGEAGAPASPLQRTTYIINPVMPWEDAVWSREGDTLTLFGTTPSVDDNAGKFALPGKARRRAMQANTARPRTRRTVIDGFLGVESLAVRDSEAHAAAAAALDRVAIAGVDRSDHSVLAGAAERALPEILGEESRALESEIAAELSQQPDSSGTVLVGEGEVLLEGLPTQRICKASSEKGSPVFMPTEYGVIRRIKKRRRAGQRLRGQKVEQVLKESSRPQLTHQERRLLSMTEWCAAVSAAATQRFPSRTEVLSLFDLDGRAVSAWHGKPLEAASLLVCVSTRLQKPLGEPVAALAAMLRRLPALRAAAVADSDFTAAAGELIDAAAAERPAPLGACAAAAGALRWPSKPLITAAAMRGALSAAPPAVLVEFVQYLELMGHHQQLVLPPRLWQEVASAAALAAESRFSPAQSSSALLAMARLSVQDHNSPPPSLEHTDLQSSTVGDLDHVTSPALAALRRDYFENALPQLSLENPVDANAIRSGIRAAEAAAWTLSHSEASALTSVVIRKNPKARNRRSQRRLRRLATREWGLSCIGPQKSYQAARLAVDALDGDVAAMLLLFLARHGPPGCLEEPPGAKELLLAAVHAAAAVHQLRGAYARRALQELPRLGITELECGALFKALRESAAKTLARRLVFESKQPSVKATNIRDGTVRNASEAVQQSQRRESEVDSDGPEGESESCLHCPEELVNDIMAFGESLAPHDARVSLGALEVLRWEVPTKARELLVNSAAFCEPPSRKDV